jgi:hypothetical protein
VRKLTKWMMIGCIAVASNSASAQLQWVPQNQTANAIKAGMEDLHAMWSCRAPVTYGGATQTLIGKTWSGFPKCLIVLGDGFFQPTTFEILAGTKYKWVPDHDMGFPADAVIGTMTKSGTHWKVCVSTSGTAWSPGYIADGNCIYEWHGQAATGKAYFVLTTLDPSVPHEAGAQDPKGNSVGGGIYLVFPFPSDPPF